jgi:hypothetical protein
MQSAPMQPKVQPSPELMEFIGRRLQEMVHPENQFVFMYAEFDDGWVGYQILQPSDDAAGAQSPKGRRGDFGLVMIEAWEEAKRHMGDDVWLVMIYVLDHGKVHARLLYPGQFNPDTELSERAQAEFELIRPRASAGFE